MSSKKVLNENKDKYQPHERRLFGLIKTQIIKTNKMKNVWQSIVRGRVKSILTDFEDICAPGFRTREF